MSVRTHPNLTWTPTNQIPTISTKFTWIHADFNPTKFHMDSIWTPTTILLSLFSNIINNFQKMTLTRIEPRTHWNFSSSNIDHCINTLYILLNIFTLSVDLTQRLPTAVQLYSLLSLLSPPSPPSPQPQPPSPPPPPTHRNHHQHQHRRYHHSNNGSSSNSRNWGMDDKGRGLRCLCVSNPRYVFIFSFPTYF